MASLSSRKYTNDYFTVRSKFSPFILNARLHCESTIKDINVLIYIKLFVSLTIVNEERKPA